MNIKKTALIFLILSQIILPKAAISCSCGCNIFSIGTSNLIPSQPGNFAFMEYSHANQTTNWKKDKKETTPNHHLQIKTTAVNFGLQTIFNKDWGTRIILPVIERKIINQEHGSMSNINIPIRQRAVGDAKLTAIYSGLQDDMSFGLIAGAKLPTGDYKNSKLSASQEIGTGSTDAIIGAYKVFNFDFDQSFKVFSQANFQKVILSKKEFVPGQEFSANLGTAYQINGNFLGKNLAKFMPQINPILQASLISKARDHGGNADKTNTGYSQIFISPAIEVNFKNIRTYFEWQKPIYRNVNGTQLVADNLYRAIIGYNF